MARKLRLCPVSEAEGADFAFSFAFTRPGQPVEGVQVYKKDGDYLVVPSPRLSDKKTEKTVFKAVDVLLTGFGL